MTEDGNKKDNIILESAKLDVNAVSKQNELQVQAGSIKGKKSKGEIFKVTLIILIVLYLVGNILGGYVMLNFNYAPFYFNSLRVLEDEVMGKVGYITVDAEKNTMYGDNEKRYFDAHQPGNYNKGATMTGSWDITGYPEVFPISQKYNPKLLNTDELVKFDIANTKNRFQFCTLMNSDLIYSDLIDVTINKFIPFTVVEKSKIDNFFSCTDNDKVEEWVKTLHTLIVNVIKDFVKTHTCTCKDYSQKYYVKLNNGNICLSNDLDKEIKKLLCEVNKCNKNKIITQYEVQNWFKRLGYANPKAIDSLVLGKIYNWALFELSDIEIKDLEGISGFKRLCDEKEDAYTSCCNKYKQQNKCESLDKATCTKIEKSLSKFDEAIKFARIQYIYRAISIVFANLFTTNKQYFPFSMDEDPRNIFSKMFSIRTPKESRTESIAILNSVLKKHMKNTTCFS